MAVDLTIGPWDRLSKLAPPDTSEEDLQAAAERHAARRDVYAAAADLWEEAALVIDLSPDPDPTPGESGTVASVSQDGISVTYDVVPGNVQSARLLQQGKYYARARALRRLSKPSTPLIHDPNYNPWINKPGCDPDEIFIIVDEV